MFIYTLSTWYSVPLAQMTASVRCGMEVIRRWHYWAFSLSVLLDRLFLIFLLKISHRFSMGFRSGMLSSQSSTVISWSANHLEGVLSVWEGAKFLLEKEISISIKLVSRWNLIQHNGPTPADVTGPQIITDFRNFSLDFKQLGFCVSPLFLQTPDLDFQTKCNTFIWKEDFGPLSNSPVIFLLSPGKMLLTMFLFQKWFGSPFPEDVWAWWLLMHWLQLQFTPCEALPSVWIGFAWQYSQACGHPCCLWTFSHPISSFQSTLHLIDTALFEQPPLSVNTLCDLSSLWRVSMIVFWTIAKSAVFPIIVHSKKQEIPRISRDTRDTQTIKSVWMIRIWLVHVSFSNHSVLLSQTEVFMHCDFIQCEPTEIWKR